MPASRAFRADDDEAIVALHARAHAADQAWEAMTLDRWRALRGTETYRDGTDFRVVEQGGAVVALLVSGGTRDPRVPGGVRRIRVLVDPEARRRGIASGLLREAEACASRAGEGVVETFVEGRWAAGRAFAAARGFSVHVQDLFLVRDARPLDAPPPPGVRLRAYAGPEDQPAWAALHDATLVRDTAFSPATPESLGPWTRAHGFALWLAETQDAVGFCHVEARGATGYVQALGVLATAEGRGIGAALLARGIDTLRAAGVERVELCTERDNLRARRLYARAGFTLAREAETLRKTPGAP